MTANVPSLNLNNELLFNAQVTMTLKAPLYITNRDLDRMYRVAAFMMRLVIKLYLITIPWI